MTGDSRYRRASELAFNYERQTFNVSSQNWPDFREFQGMQKPRKSAPAFAAYWCHGAPGIALSRLRAFELLNDPMCKSEAAIGLQTTIKQIKAALASGTDNYSLCHGLSGNAEILNYGRQVLGETTNSVGLVETVGSNGAKLYSHHGRPWPTGTPGGQTPSLMLGLAGIGHFYLRLYSPAIPSVLLLQREHFLRRMSTPA